MILLTDIKSSINQQLKNKFHYKIYGREIKDDFDRPCFFVELLPSGSDAETQNFTSNKLTVIITYFQVLQQDKGYSDLENIKMFDSLKELFKLNLPVGSRTLHPQNIRSAYTGDNLDILQTSFDLDYFDGTGRQRNTEEPASSVNVNLKEV
ncbi:MAG TPA: hypothetical protein VHO71_04700 [Caproiciproducens sp.]|nr:hypothetical protein [Caproiciproducens sp.]